MARKLTLAQAKELRVGQTLYVIGKYNANGTAMRVRVSGKPKLWKTRPAEVQVPVKHGMYDSGYITHNNLGEFILAEPEAKKVSKAKKPTRANKTEYVGYEIVGGVPVHHYQVK